MEYRKSINEVKSDSYTLANLPISVRNNALRIIHNMLSIREEDIYNANAKDLEAASELPEPIFKRLKFDKAKLNDCLYGIESLLRLPDPLGLVLLDRELDKDLELTKTTCPIGVIGVIFESRPDALIQIATLCIKSGNSTILKGGKEALNTNMTLFSIIHEAGIKAGLPKGFALSVEDRSGIDEILAYDHAIDLIIPRGSNEFVQYIMANSRIPVMGHADGICHIYVDESANLLEALPIIIDSKTQYVAACNSVETILLHENIADQVLDALAEAKVPIELRHACGEDDYREYLDYIMTIKKVSDVSEAIEHINKYGSHHTDCILAEDSPTIEKFMDYVDSAGVYSNCSTRFADGFRYGFGAEVGISTGKLHARGPVGLDGLVTYKYRLRGNGQIVSEYASGEKHFLFTDKS